MSHVIEIIRQALIQNADEKVKESVPYFFKEKIRLYGVKTAIVRKIEKQHFNTVKEKYNKEEILNFCEQFWKSGYIEESFIACNWSYYIHKEYQQKDFKVFEKWIKKYVNNWASCDTLCNHTIGTFLDRYPHYVSNLKKWTKSSSRWVRRAAAVSLIIPAKQGKFLSDVFEIAELLLWDQDDLVQKGYGWMLKAASQAHQKKVFVFIMKHKAHMPRTALRYATEKMPKALRLKVRR